MADDSLALLGQRGFELQLHAHLFRTRAAQSQLFGEVAAQRARDEEHCLAIFDRLFELSMSAGKERRAPWRQLIRLEATREQDRMPAIATELALQLARADRRHRAQRAKTQEIQAFELFNVEWELVRREGSEEGLRLVHLHEAAGSRARRGEPGGERSGTQTESWFPADRGAQPAPSLANRFARVDDAAHVQPRNALDANLDCRREVVERGGDELLQVGGGFGIRREESCLRAEMLGLPQGHPGHHAKWKRLIGSGDHVLFPESDHHGIPVQVRASGQLEVTG